MGGRWLEETRKGRVVGFIYVYGGDATAAAGLASGVGELKM